MAVTWWSPTIFSFMGDHRFRSILLFLVSVLAPLDVVQRPITQLFFVHADLAGFGFSVLAIVASSSKLYSLARRRLTTEHRPCSFIFCRFSMEGCPPVQICSFTRKKFRMFEKSSCAVEGDAVCAAAPAARIVVIARTLGIFFMPVPFEIDRLLEVPHSIVTRPYSRRNRAQRVRSFVESLKPTHQKL